MKNLVLSFILVGVILFGSACDDALVNPDSQELENSSEMSVQSGDEFSDIALPRFNKKGKKGNKDTGLTVTGVILSKKSSDLVMDSYYYDDNADGKDKKGKKGKKGKKDNKVEVYAKIDYPAGAVDEDVEITMTFDPESMMFVFGPSMVFNKSAKLTVKITGLDLKGVKKHDVEFHYLKADGSNEWVKCSNIGINDKKGELKVANLKINHFSRFKFTR